ncbi:chromate transporter [Desulfuribacillus alkaliarsenatis]|uniref:Transporter n=1 Tax=Desulfuribacillus alkaliarsenatis TaxID=766136 RepID=A0A1E5FZN8_9FIRM|nr:chromate transporter [Desulfuribacillus alkaliarsenatis]OEF96032.1 hypothetical protein BHF68_09810 [Desulfuribacillus alkaliarsenatis]
MQNWIDLFIAFFRANIVGYGGGPASIPLIRKEVVDIYGWMTNEEFANALAIGNSLPGPITTKLAAYIGYEVAGIPGAFISILATVGPTAVAMVLLFSFLMKFKDTKAVKGLMLAIQPVIIVLLLHVVFEIGKGAYINVSYMLVGITLVAFLGVFYFEIHPVVLIIFAMAMGMIFSEYII